ncbi:divergent polysaccharide deacetylase family protein [Rhodophyticola sp.]|jgi:polysaccharide deacetylase 2 family uncharacterized protein YibQ|uniref:divergent polysaccharide deacetylase family protein n=1 Tax=Rhodophyticola sp. TaxID=2680032 RepID=UPI003D29DD8B
MGRGVVTGMLLGVLFAALFLAILSLSAPLPNRSGGVNDAPSAPSGTPVPEETAGAETAPAAVAPAPEQPGSEPPADTTPADPAPTPADPAPAEDAPADRPAASADTATRTGPADNVPLPAGSEFNRPPPEQAATVPAPDSAPVSAPPQGSPAPAPDTLAASPVPDTAPAPRPTGTAALDLPQVQSPVPDTSTPEVSDTSADPLAPPPELQPAPLGLPQIDTDPGTPTTMPAPAPELPEEPATGAPAAGEETARAAPAPTVTPAPPASFRPALPRIGDAADASEPQAAETAAGVPVPDPSEGEDPRPAIEAYAAPFDPSETRPLMAVILIDDPAFGSDRSVLLDFPFPVSFAIDPTAPGAAESAAAYRAAGFEVLILAGMLPDGAAPSDVETALAGALDVLPETVALLDTDQNRVQGDRPVLDAVVAALADTGHGLVAYPRGLNAAEQSAVRAGVPAATLFRQIDSERERATVITRYLDRAAFAAGQEGRVIVVGHTYSDTVTALFSWALGDRSESVVMAPVSAVLTR